MNALNYISSFSADKYYTPVKYVTGDATSPHYSHSTTKEMRFIVHCCNDIGAWGSGFVMALSNKWPITKSSYHTWYDGFESIFKTTGPLQLGEVQFVLVTPDITVCNLIGQRSVAGTYCQDNTGIAPVRYEAITLGLAKIRLAMAGLDSIGYTCSFHSPKFGAARAGGDWDLIENIIVEIMSNTGIPCTVYNFDCAASYPASAAARQPVSNEVSNA